MVRAFLFVILTIPFAAQAAFSPAEVIAASKVKRGVYVSDSVFWGGDALANPMSLRSVRWASNQGFERLVIDLGGEGQGWETKLPPYFQVGVSSSQNKISVSIKGITERGISEDVLARSLKKSSMIQDAYLAPPLEGDLAALEFSVRKPVDIESFYLVNPPRIVIDVRAHN
jgi:hypothetical protein